MRETDAILGRLTAIASGEAHAYPFDWKSTHGRKVIGTFPMNFPNELVHAAGALPVTVQESHKPITLGRGLIYEFYCGYTRSLTDQAVTGQLDQFDAFLLVDHCVALLGAVDAMRFALPDKPVYLAQYTAAMDEACTPPEIRTRVEELKSEVERICGTTISNEALAGSIRLFNRQRQLLRQLYDLRRCGKVRLTATQMQALVKSSMVMDVEEHIRLLAELIDGMEKDSAADAGPVRLHLSGHFCHAPPTALLDMIEECGAIVVDDDLFAGFRYISTDVPEDGDPVGALARWYFERNVTVPCPTRAQKNVDWEQYLVRSVEKSGAEGVIVLIAKFCEPHMLYYPELRKELQRRGIPHLVIETEREGLAVEALRTRVEALLEGIRRNALVSPAAE